jgi:4-amino-4-deoxychorismate lyase
MIATLINGVECGDEMHAISVRDRGLTYGDGLFETMLVKGGRVRLLDAHLLRLFSGCKRLGIPCPDESELRMEIERVCGSAESGVIKLIVTRGIGERSYRPDDQATVTRILSIHDIPARSNQTISIRWCEMRLSRNPALAGMKHLNRLEQVLAQREWNDPTIAEGLMRDSEGELVCATAANVFIVRGQELVTSDLRYCGIRGVMRDEVLRLARTLGIPVSEEPLWPEDLDGANEVFVTNAVRGIRSVVSLEQLSWPSGPIAQALREALYADAHEGANANA